jgi:Na+/melibiose symporter-like transporter
LYKVSFSVFDRDLQVFLLGLALFFVGNSSDAFLFFASAKPGRSNSSSSGAVSRNECYHATSSFPFGIISDKIGQNSVLLIGFAIFFAVYIGFTLASSALVVWILFALYGLYYGLTDGVSRAL